MTSRFEPACAGAAGGPRYRRSTRKPSKVDFAVDSLEPRKLLAAVVWDGGGDGMSWGDRLNWGGDVLPAATDDVTINLPNADPTVRFSSGAQSVRTLSSSELFELSGGVLTVTDSIELDAPSVMSGGTLKGAGILRGSWPGAPYVPGRLQSALDLGNGSRFVEVDDPADRHLDVGNGWTIEAWVNFNNVPTGDMQTIASKDEGPGDSNKWILSYCADYAGVLRATMLHINLPGVGAAWLASNQWVPVPHVWYHIAVVKTNGDYVFYRDGVADGVAHTDVAMPTVIQAPLQIGSAEGGFALDGWVDDVRLWNV